MAPRAGRTIGTRAAPRPATVDDEIEDSFDEDMDEFDAVEETGGDKMQLDPRVKADAKERGVVVQWKRFSTLGKPDGEYYGFLMRRRWVPVPAKMYAKWGVCLPGTPPDDPVIRDGQILMERAKKYQDRAEEQQRELAQGQVADKERQLYETPANTAERTLVRVSKQYAPVENARLVGRQGGQAVVED